MSHKSVTIILLDDVGYGDFKFNNEEAIAKTPNIDNLLKKNTLIFDHIYSAGTVCTPTRASIITGRHPKRDNIDGINARGGNSKNALKKDRWSIGSLLQENDIKTGFFGKWHLGDMELEKKEDEHVTPDDHGFDEWICTESRATTTSPTCPCYYSKDYCSLGMSGSVGECAPYYSSLNIEYYVNGSDALFIVDRYKDFIDKYDHEFFSIISLHDVHKPLLSTNEEITRCLNTEICNVIEGDVNSINLDYWTSLVRIDDAVGEVVNILKNKNIFDDALIIFISDNGPEKGLPGISGGRGRKRSLYEGGIRSPGFIYHNTVSKSNRTNYVAVSSDIVPTVLEFFDIPLPSITNKKGITSDLILDGISLFDVMRNNSQTRVEPLFFYQTNFKTKIAGIDYPWKFLDNKLYNLIDDPNESLNLKKKKKNKNI